MRKSDGGIKLGHWCPRNMPWKGGRSLFQGKAEGTLGRGPMMLGQVSNDSQETPAFQVPYKTEAAPCFFEIENGYSQGGCGSSQKASTLSMSWWDMAQPLLSVGDVKEQARRVQPNISCYCLESHFGLSLPWHCNLAQFKKQNLPSPSPRCPLPPSRLYPLGV